MKYQSSPDEWTQGDPVNGWKRLRFPIADPQYFVYSYRSSGTAGSVGDMFSAIANGDLNGDGTLSTFQIDGKIVASSTGNDVFVAPNLIETNPEE